MTWAWGGGGMHDSGEPISWALTTMYNGRGSADTLQ